MFLPGPGHDHNAFSFMPEVTSQYSHCNLISRHISCRKQVPGYLRISACSPYVPSACLLVILASAKLPRFSLAHVLHWPCIETLGELYHPLYYFTTWAIHLHDKSARNHKPCTLGHSLGKNMKSEGAVSEGIYLMIFRMSDLFVRMIPEYQHPVLILDCSGKMSLFPASFSGTLL